MDVLTAIDRILERRHHIPKAESMLMAISGIDGSGKGYTTSQLVDGLRQQGINAAGINIDGWLNLPPKRFNREHPAEHFYLHAIRFEEMFDQLVLPLKKKRSIRIVANYTEETAEDYRLHTYSFEDVDIILLEGIFLMKRAFRPYYDLSIWVDCSFRTALERALQRKQEGLSDHETIHAYKTIYFPAQQIHLAVDAPLSAVDLVMINDPSLYRT